MVPISRTRRLLRRQLPVHEGHLEFVFEITEGPHAPDDELSALGLGEVHQKAVEAGDGDPGVVASQFAQHLHALIHREGGLLGWIVEDGHDEMVHQLLGPLDDVPVAQGHGVERAWIDGRTHRCSGVSP